MKASKASNVKSAPKKVTSSWKDRVTENDYQ